MKTLPEIPFADIRGGTSLDLLKRYPDGARALARAATNSFGFASRVASALALPLGDRASRAWLVRAGNPFLPEIDALAELLQIRGVYFLNLCFEWGCTGGVWTGPDGPVMRRVLDWPFPGLGTSMVVALQSGPAGDFYNITWPGLSGSFQGFAPGRFAAAINQAPMRGHRAGYAGDWLKNRIQARNESGLPPAHLLRQVLEQAPDYAAARTMLSETRLAVPALFLLSGTRDGEGCVIERTETEVVLRPLESRAVCVANHFESRIGMGAAGWRARPIDSLGRAAAARSLQGGAEDFAWFQPPIANHNSRLAFVANAANGALALMGTAGAAPATQVFRLPMGTFGKD
ncbi:MAG: hypothetical protein WDM91_15655 [Rhizomicrobium sp.]